MKEEHYTYIYLHKPLVHTHPKILKQISVYLNTPLIPPHVIPDPLSHSFGVHDVHATPARRAHHHQGTLLVVQEYKYEKSTRASLKRSH